MGQTADPFYLFGMGNRRKLLYKQGALSDARSGDLIRRWELGEERIEPSEYRVLLELRSGGQVTIWEDERGVWLEDGGGAQPLAKSPLLLPRFEHYPHAALLRVLHHEILINIVDGRPLPNFFVYAKPWYRDAAMMAMCLAQTANVGLLENWIGGLREPYDCNNGGIHEPDNLGQALYLVSLVSDRSHPLVRHVLAASPEWRRESYIAGMTDFAEHPVYQTKWLKFGLRRLGLDDPYEIPSIYDSYSALFWMDYRDAHVPGPPFPAETVALYPYLGWAEAHFHRWRPAIPSADAYPLTWEAQASQADYSGMQRISAEYVDRRICAPHTWHAAELFLYLLDRSLQEQP